MSLSYQLEILWYQVCSVRPRHWRVASKLIQQAQRMRALGWADYLTVQMTQNRKSMTVSYWM